MNPTPIVAETSVHHHLDFVDTFDVDVDRGDVIGSRASSGVVRHGVDIEGVMGIDHGALRIRPMIEQGWGRSLVTYGPYTRRDGLLFAALVLNGHNTSQSEVLPESLATRMLRWLQGHGDRRIGLLRRLGQWLRHRRKSYLFHKLRTWRRMASGDVVPLDENLAVGWFPVMNPKLPGDGGNVFVMHAALGDNGELWARSGPELLPVNSGIQNVPMCYLTVLRESGAAYYLASVRGANGAAPYPLFRPYAIDSAAADPEVYAGVHQAALGQIGFRVDTRVYATQVRHVDALATWYGTAHAADALSGSGPLDGDPAEVGGSWSVPCGGFRRDDGGVQAMGARNLAVLQPGNPSGLLHVLAIAPGDDGAVGLVWRYRDPDNHVRLELGNGGAIALKLVEDGVTTSVATSTATHITRGSPCSIQLTDDGHVLRCAIDGRPAFVEPITLDVFTQDHGVGVWACGSGTSDEGVALLSQFEAHPREVDLGGVVTLPEPWFASGNQIVVSDDFRGPAGELAGRETPCGGVLWRRQYGRGRMRVTGSGTVAVDASVERPNPGNTAYLVDWHHPDFVDVAVDVTPPGTALGQGHRGRGGLVLWEDPDDYLMISMYVDDSYDGASIAIFSHLDGFEDIYDAVWSMVGKKIYWGATHRLRVVSDGHHVMIFIDDEPVLYRSITDLYPDRGPLRINAVGLAANWEWGDDTGTTFANFTSRAPGAHDVLAS